MSGKSGVGIVKRHIFRALKYLNDCFVLVDLHNTSHFVFFAVYDKIYDFIIKSILNAFQRIRGPLMLLRPKYSIAILFSLLTRSFP